MFDGMLLQGTYLYEVIPEHRVSEYYGRGYMVDRGKELRRQFLEWYRENHDSTDIRHGWETYLLRLSKNPKKVNP
jgi:hypothetical protein